MTERARKPRVVCITQARMGSTRLPGKVLLTVAGRPLLAHQVARLRRAALVDEVVVATSDGPADDAIASLCRRLGVACFRGSEHDVLDRFYRAAVAYNADVAVRVTGDCPLIDPGLIDQLLTLFLASDPPLDHAAVDIVHYPRGLDAEAISMPALQTAWREATAAFEREHVTPYIYRRPSRFRLGALPPPAGPAPVEMGPQRWCVDTVEDFQLVRRLLEALLPVTPDFTWTDCLALLRQHPDWALLNRDVAQKTLP
ncbi:MAG: glycosyltransferase family protein [Azospirillaceae bacterium]|nr:glycosyltransferase family protein [Azospirillaceae bacterium]